MSFVFQNIMRADARCYLTSDNGGRPFKVCLDGARFRVFKDGRYLRDEDGEGEGDRYAEEVLRPTPYTEAFVEKSSLLFAVGKPGSARYVFVGDRVIGFKTAAPVVRFASPVGNSDVPYPFAIDLTGAIYLLAYGVALAAPPYPKGVAADPYRFYHRENVIAPGGKGRRPDDRPPFEGIAEFYIGASRYNLEYNNIYDPALGDDYDSTVRRCARRPSAPPKMYVRKEGGKRTELTREAYAALFRRFGRARGFRPIRFREIHPAL